MIPIGIMCLVIIVLSLAALHKGIEKTSRFMDDVHDIAESKKKTTMK